MAEQQDQQVQQELEYDQYAPQTNGRLFSSAMFGFSKEEVLEYLDELADENFQRQEAAERRIQELTRKIQSLETVAASHVGQPQTSGAIEASNAKLKEAIAHIEKLKQDYEISKAATQQSEEELFESKEQLYTAQQENSWLREEYQKSDRQIAELRRQLDAASSGQWTDADEQISELRRQLDESGETLEETNLALDEANAALDEANAALDEANAALDEMEEQQEQQQQHQHQHHESQAERAASIILAEANAEAERIRAEAYEERDRIQRQISYSAGGLAESITTLRGDVSDVEGDVSSVLETVQVSLSEILAALARTEQNLSSFGVQVDRFPSTAPPVSKGPPPIVYFQPTQQMGVEPQAQPVQQQPAQQQPVATSAPAPVVRYRTTQPNTYSGSGFRRVWPDNQPSKETDNTRPFRATYSSSPTNQGVYLSTGAEAYERNEEANEERLRNLTDTLVETLRQMLN